MRGVSARLGRRGRGLGGGRLDGAPGGEPLPCIDVADVYSHHADIRPSGVRPLNYPERAESLGLFLWAGI
jgi:hypothetical protein